MSLKLESAAGALARSAGRTEQVAGGNKQAYGKLHARLRQTRSALDGLHPSDVGTLSSEARLALGLRFGEELSKVLAAFPQAMAELELEGKGAKATSVERALLDVLERIAVTLEPIPIVPPEIAPLLGDPPHIDADNAPAIVAKLEVDLAKAEPRSEADGGATPEQRLAALFLTDAVADQLAAALAARGGDGAGVQQLRMQGSSWRLSIGRPLRIAGAIAATAAIAVPTILGLTATGGSGSGEPVGAHGTVATKKVDRPGPGDTPTSTKARPTVDPKAEHLPRRIRVVRSDGHLASPSLADELTAAGFAPQAFVDVPREPGVDPIDQALATFQASAGLEPTGTVDAETRPPLAQSIIVADPKNPAFSPAEALGEHSGDVRRTEQVMADLHLIPQSKVDGTFDATTQHGSRVFEDAHPGLGKDGSIDLAQFRAMVRELIKVDSAKPRVVSRPSPNQSSREGTDIDTIVLHHTASNDVAADLATLRSPAAEVSAHYLIGRDGTIYQLVPDGRKAWHAGDSVLHGVPDVNLRSIGIEITNDGSGHTPFTTAQYQALRQLVPYLVAKYDVPLRNIVGHKDIAVPAGRKGDPAPNFDKGQVLQAVHRLEQLEKLV